MTLKLYNNTAERNRVDKSGYLTQYGSDITGELRSEADIMHPEITYELQVGDTITYNYCYVVEIARYYFIDKIIVVRKGLVRLILSEDVLMTYKGSKSPKSGIYGLSAYITRVQDSQNFALSDNVYPMKLNAGINTYTGALASGETWKGSKDFMKDDNSVFRYIMLSQGQLTDGNNNVYQNALPLASVVMTDLGCKALMTRAGASGVSITGKLLNDYMYSLLCFPFGIDYIYTAIPEIDFPGITSQLQFPTQYGSHSVVYYIPELDADSNVLHENNWEITLTTPSTSKAYKNFGPYNKVMLQFQPFGRFELDTGIIYSDTNASTVKVKVKVVTEIMTGIAQLYYGKTTANILLGSAQVGVKCPLSSASYNAAKVAGGIISAGAGIMAAIASGGAAAPVAGAAAGVVSASTSAGTASNSVSAGDMIIVDEAPVIQQIHYDVYDEDASLFGWAFSQSDYLSNHSGFCQVGRVHVEGFLAYEDEKAEIESLLKQGVIL